MHIMFHLKYSIDELSIYQIFDDKTIWPVAPEQDHGLRSSSEENQVDNTSVYNGASETNAENFDETLQRLWNDADRKQLFRYSFKQVPSRIVSEKFQFILQLNPERATKRRMPQEIQHVNQTFNPEEFNFNKVKSEETIMTLASLSQAQHNAHQDDDESRSSSIIVNVSWLEYCHILLVPAPLQNQPQSITIDGLKSAVEILLLSHSCDFRVGFNSLCGFASVNHHHYHAYYLKHRLYIEFADLQKVAGPCYQFKDSEYPAPGFIFILKDLKELDGFLNSCFQLISHLQKNDIAHNVYITRGSTTNIKNYFDCVRLIVWGRVSSFGSKVCHAFNPALCELAGHFPLKNEESYSTMTEEFIFNELRGICQNTFEQVKFQVRLLWKDQADEAPVERAT